MFPMIYFYGVALCNPPHLEAASEIQIPTGSHVFTRLFLVPIFYNSNPIQCSVLSSVPGTFEPDTGALVITDLVLNLY
jgi:hypothetical protein